MRASQVVDKVAANELDLYAENEFSLYAQKKAILANIRAHRAKGTFDPRLAPRLWMYWVDAAAKKYVREFGAPGSRIDSMFNRATRVRLAEELARRYALGDEDKAGMTDPSRRRRPAKTRSKRRDPARLTRRPSRRTRATAPRRAKGGSYQVEYTWAGIKRNRATSPMTLKAAQAAVRRVIAKYGRKGAPRIVKVKGRR